jgi:hypothetical protein
VPDRPLDDDVRAWLRFAGGARGSLRVGSTAVGNTSAMRLRVFGAGHTDGLIGAFADIYAAAARAIPGRTPLPEEFADVRDGAYGLAFVEAAIASHRAGTVWTSIAEVR